MPSDRGFVFVSAVIQVSCRGITPRCSHTVNCPCNTCVEGASAALSLSTGRLLLRLKGDAESVFDVARLSLFGLSVLQAPAVTVGFLSEQPWHLADIIVDPAHLDDVHALFPTTPVKHEGYPGLRLDGGYTRTALYFDNPRAPDSKEAEDAELMAQARAAAVRQAMLKENWWRDRAVTVALGTHERVGDRSMLRALDPDIIEAILALVRTAGPASATEYVANEGGKPDYYVFHVHPQLTSSCSRRNSTLPSQQNFEGCWCVTSVSAVYYDCSALLTMGLHAGAAQGRRPSASTTWSSSLLPALRPTFRHARSRLVPTLTWRGSRTRTPSRAH